MGRCVCFPCRRGARTSLPSVEGYLAGTEWSWDSWGPSSSDGACADVKEEVGCGTILERLCCSHSTLLSQSHCHSQHTVLSKTCRASCSPSNFRRRQ